MNSGHIKVTLGEVWHHLSYDMVPGRGGWIVDSGTIVLWYGTLGSIAWPSGGWPVWQSEAMQLSPAPL